MSQPKVAIMILNWNGLKDTIECLDSLKRITYPNYEVMVVDNGSEGDDAQVLEDRFRDYIRVIKNNRNYGAGGGINIGMKYFLGNSDAEFLLLLDNDTVVAPEFLTEMAEVIEADSTIGTVSAMVHHYDEPNRIHFNGGKIDLWGLDFRLTFGLIIKTARQKIFGSKDTHREQDNSAKEVDQVSFWCALLRRKFIESIGLLAEEYCGLETVDYYIRAKESGYKVVQVPRAKVWHKFRSSSRIDGVLQYRGCRGLFRFMRNHATKWQFRCFLFQFFAVHLWLATVYYLIWHRSPRVLLRFYKGVRDGLFKVKGN